VRPYPRAIVYVFNEISCPLQTSEKIAPLPTELNITLMLNFPLLSSGRPINTVQVDQPSTTGTFSTLSCGGLSHDIRAGNTTAMQLTFLSCKLSWNDGRVLINADNEITTFDQVSNCTDVGYCYPIPTTVRFRRDDVFFTVS
jgi:hypothetical protein